MRGLPAATVFVALILMHGLASAAGDAFLEDVDVAFALARESGRPVVIDFFTTWCQPCEEMARTTWRDEDVLAALARCVPLAVDAERAPGFAARYGALSYPTVVIAAPDGAVVLVLQGMQDAEAMRTHLLGALDRWDTLAPAARAAAGGKPDAAALVELADFGRERGAWDHAERLYRRALSKRKKLSPELVERAEAGLGTLYAETGRCREARRWLPEDSSLCAEP